MTQALVAVLTTGDRDVTALVTALESVPAVQGVLLVVNGVGAVPRLTRDFPKLRVVYEPQRGFASARNAALDYVVFSEESRYLIFFDDDQMPRSGWAEALLREAASTSADVVFGPVVCPTLPGKAWAEPEDLRQPLPYTTGWHSGDVYSGNTLLSVPFLRRTAVRFDAAYDAIGGEDTHFFRACRVQGARIRFAADAVAEEMPDLERLTFLGRFRDGRRRGVRNVFVSPMTVGVATKRAARLPRGLLLVALGAFGGSRATAGRGIFDIGYGCGYLSGRLHVMRGA